MEEKQVGLELDGAVYLIEKSEGDVKRTQLSNEMVLRMLILAFDRGLHLELLESFNEGNDEQSVSEGLKEGI